MAKRTSTPKVTETTNYRHDDAKRKNIPTAAIEAEGQLPKARRVHYAYSPHLEPVLRFDPAGRSDKVAAIVEKTCRGERLDKSEQEILHAVGQNWEQPWLEWAGKQEEHIRGHFSVDPVALHIHERISAQAILRHALREDAQRSLFAAPEQTYAEALQFYKHDVDWANRLILGDSLQVMSSLAQRENLAGMVQTIYIDPPYGIKFGSNFQPEVGKRDVKDGKDDDLTREPEMVRAFRDTWHLGTSSYLGYLRDRLRVARALLTTSGSVFVQISEVNLHRVRAVLDEVFGVENFAGLIAFTKTVGQSTDLVPSTMDYLVWFARDIQRIKFHKLFLGKAPGGEGATGYTLLDFGNGDWRGMNREEIEGDLALPSGGKVFDATPIVSQGWIDSLCYRVSFEGVAFAPPDNRHWTTTASGMRRLESAGRLVRSGRTLQFRKFLDDYPATELSNIWIGLGERGFVGSKLYVVQTAARVIQRCILMTTDPGDLVLDPTCGSGTTAHVAEQWGRRWITIDTSRVALSIARQRILTAKFDHYRTKGGPTGNLGAENPSSGFRYKAISHITLGAIAQNTNLDPIFAKHEPILTATLEAANEALAAVPAHLKDKLKAKLAAKEKTEGKKSVTDADCRRWILPPNNRDLKEKWTVDAMFAGWYEWEVPFDTDSDWPKALQDAVIAHRSAWRAKMDDVNKCIADNAEQEELVDQPEVVRNVVRVSGPFTVEGVIPEELSLAEGRMFDPTPNEFESDDGDVPLTVEI